MWNHPAAKEEDDSRPDFEEIRRRRYYQVFDRPIDEDLRACGYEVTLNWLRVHHPNVVAELEKRIARLWKHFDKPRFVARPDDPPEVGYLAGLVSWQRFTHKEKNAILSALADTAFFLFQLARFIEPVASAKQAEQTAVHGGPSDTVPECLVTLQQAAGMVSRCKRSLQRLLPKMPAPRVQGAGGKPSEWAWSELRPWLEKNFERPLPERFPADRFRPT